MLHHGVPAIWVPLPRNVDDQEKRVQWVLDNHAGLRVNTYETPALQYGIRALCNPDCRQELAAHARQLVPANGAEAAADYLLKWLG